MNLLQRKNGFTLIEMITVIIILGVLSVGFTTFLKFGSRIFAETSARDELISSARFAIERLNREVRHAAPNSIYVDTSGSYDCLVFTPILATSTYIDLPVAPEAASNQIEVIPFNTSSFANAARAIVYPLNKDDYLIASNKNHAFSSLNTSIEPWLLSFSTALNFATDSPTERLYFYGDNTSYCVEGNDLVRYQAGASRTLMAENLVNYLDAGGSAYSNPGDVKPAFNVIEATQTRNATAQIRLYFELNQEQVRFNNEVQIPNVP